MPSSRSRLSVVTRGHLLTACHPAYEISWDLNRGGIPVYLRDRRSGVAIIDARHGGPAPDVVVAASATLEEHEHDLPMSGMGSAEVTEFRADRGRVVRLEFAVQDDEVRIERTVTLRLDTPWIEESIALQNVCDHDLLIDRYPDWAAAGKTAVAGDLYHWGVNPGGVDYLFKGLCIDGDYASTRYVTPACGYPFFYNHGHFAEMGDTAISLVAGHHGAVLPCAMAWSGAAQTGLLVSCLHERSLRYVHLCADQQARTGTIGMQVWWARWLAPGERQTVATWHLVPFTGDYGEMLDEYRHWLADVHGIVPPKDAASHLDELFVGSTHSVVLHSLGHCDKLRPYVDALAEVGCTAYWWGKPWLDAIDVNKHAWMSRCQPQSRDDRYACTTRYGGEPAIRALTDYIHERGMKDIAWVTGYGLTVFDPMYKENPEMWVRLRRPVKRQATTDIPGHELIPDFDNLEGVDDDMIYTPFGGATIGADTTHPRWRKFWLHSQEYWAANGLDGIFFDSFNPMPPNYALRPWPGQISLEIVNLQREARRRALAANPDFFTFTEGGGYLMATVNDFTHTWSGSTAPPLPPFRTAPLTPAEEARFHRDEILSMIPGSRSWASVASVSGDSAKAHGTSVRPRVLFNLYAGRMPVLGMFVTGCQPEAITNEPEFWSYYRACPPDQPPPHEKSHWDYVGAQWRIRMAHPELKSGSILLKGVTASDPGVFVFARERHGRLSVVALNFHPEPVTCTISLDWRALGMAAPRRKLVPRDLLRDEALTPATAAQWRNGRTVELPARDGRVIKLL